jgi:hypothetical protein
VCVIVPEKRERERERERDERERERERESERERERERASEHAPKLIHILFPLDNPVRTAMSASLAKRDGRERLDSTAGEENKKALSLVLLWRLLPRPRPHTLALSHLSKPNSGPPSSNTLGGHARPGRSVYSSSLWRMGSNTCCLCLQRAWVLVGAKTEYTHSPRLPLEHHSLGGNAHSVFAASCDGKKWRGDGGG